MSGICVGGGGSRGSNGLDNTQGGSFSPLDRRIFDSLSFELAGEAPVHADVSLGVRGVSRVREVVQEVGRCNRPPCLRNLFFTKLVHLELGVIGVLDLVPVDLEDFEARDGWILERRIDQQGGI